MWLSDSPETLSTELRKHFFIQHDSDSHWVSWNCQVHLNLALGNIKIHDDIMSGNKHDGTYVKEEAIQQCWAFRNTTLLSYRGSKECCEAGKTVLAPICSLQSAVFTAHCCSSSRSTEKPLCYQMRRNKGASSKESCCESGKNNAMLLHVFP